MKLPIQDAIDNLTDEAELLGADADDSRGIVRAVVAKHGLSFYAWFCVCCQIADRAAQRQGFKNQADRAASRMVHNG